MVKKILFWVLFAIWFLFGTTQASEVQELQWHLDRAVDEAQSFVWSTDPDDIAQLEFLVIKISELYHAKKSVMEQRANKVQHNRFPEGSIQQQYVDYAFAISWGDKDFILTLQAENSAWSIDRQSNYYRNGRREPSFGLCQINKDYHADIVNDPRFFSDWKRQIETCWNSYRNWVRFYGYDVRHRYAWSLIFG